MKKNISRFSIVMAAVAVLMSSCSLDEYNPKEVTGDEILATYEGVYGMQAQCYKPIYGQLFTVFDYLSMTECGTDTWWHSNDKSWAEQMFYYEELTVSTEKSWDKAFTQAYSALGLVNTVINRCDNITENPENVKILKAEAKYLRAFYHLILTTYYGPITLVTEEPSENVNLKPKRNTLSEIYASITTDLKDAIQDLPVAPFEGNRARATKKAAKGLLCRAYIQGAGQGLSEDGVSFWQRAKDESEDFIANKASYGAELYDDVADTWADTNNRSNKEALFVAAGIDACEDLDTYGYANPGSNKLFIHCYWGISNLADLNNTSDYATSYLYGRTNEGHMAPSYYLMHCFNPSWDKRWENSFQTAFFNFSMVNSGDANFTYAKSQVKVVKDRSRDLCTKYGIDATLKNKPIYPYVDLEVKTYTNGGAQYIGKVWPKGETSGDVSKLVSAKKIYVVDYPVAKDDNRFFLYLYPNWADEYKDGFDKSGRIYATAAIDELMVPDHSRYVSSASEMTTLPSESDNVWETWPSLNKFIWNYDGVYNSNSLQIRNGDVMVQRFAEIYLIAAEAEQHLGNGAKAAEYLNILRERAKRDSYTGDVTLKNATEEDIFDEYAREMCGEFQRWALLQRHGLSTMKDRLQKYNVRASKSFLDRCYWRPISGTFLQQIDNTEEYGDNGYGTTAKSGLDGYLQ